MIKFVDIWTIQTPNVLEVLQVDGVCYALTPDDHEEEYYRWLLEQYESRMGVKAPTLWWGWFDYNGLGDRIPKLNDKWLLPTGTSGVLLHLRKRRTEVLLSQFQMWCLVMSNHFILAPPKDDEDDPEHWRFVKRQTQSAKRESWERIFDLQYGAGCFGHQIQACFHEMRSDELVSSKDFIAK